MVEFIHENPFKLKVQSCKSRKNKYMIASTQKTNIEIFAFIAAFIVIEP